MSVVVEHLSPAVVEVPKTALSLATTALGSGWEVRLTTVRATPKDDEGEDVRTVTLVRHDNAETGGGSTRVYGDAKVVDSVVLRARRGPDSLWASWQDGKFEHAYRRDAVAPALNSAGLREHLLRSPDDHRWFALDQTTDYCLHHSCRRPKELT